MTKAKLVLTCIVLSVFLVSVLAACAPEATTTAPAATEEPAAEQTAATEQPAATEEPAATATEEPAAAEEPAAEVTLPETSYSAKTYSNDEYGFIFLYPSSMAEATPTAKYNVFSAADAMQIPAVSASILESDKVDEQTAESLESAGGSDVTVVSTEDITLADGKTPAVLTELLWKSSGYDITTYSVSVEKDGKTISVSYTSLKDMIDPTVGKEVVNTLTLK